MSLVKLINTDKSFQKLLKSNIPPKTFFTTNTGYPPFSTNNPILVRYSLESSYQSCILGTASDYMFRFIIAKTINKSEVLENLTAEKGLDHITKTYYNKFNLAKQDGSNDQIKFILQNLNHDFNKCKSTIQSYIKGEDQLFDQLITISVWFAQLEDVYRNALDSAVEIAISKREEPYIEKELHQLCNVFTQTFIETNIITPNSDVVFNPVFGEWSEKIGGADADIYIDGTIYDFKSTKKVNYNWEYIAQIFSYFALYLLDKQNKHSGTLADREVKNIALYYSRYGLINTCSLLDSNFAYDTTFLQDFSQLIENYEKELSCYKKLAINFNGYETIFPQFSKLFIDREVFGSASAEDYISKAFPTFSYFKTDLFKSNPTFWSGNFLPDIIHQQECFYIIRFKACFNIKNGKQPFIKSKIGFTYPKNKVLTTSDVYHNGKYYKFYRDFDGRVVKARPILVLTKDDYRLFLENYEVCDIEILDGCYFN